MFQYRKKVTPFAATDASSGVYVFLKFQYRKKVTPFAAPPFRRYYVTRPQQASKKYYPLTVFLPIPCYR